MSDEVEVNIFGVKELNEFFKTMAAKDQKKLFLSGFRIGTKGLVTLAKQNLKSRLLGKRKTTGTLMKSIGFISMPSKNTSAYVAAKVGARKFGPYKGYHGHLLNNGTADRKTKKGVFKGRTLATHFFTDAVASEQENIQNIGGTEMMKALEKQVNKQLRKVKI